MRLEGHQISYRADPFEQPARGVIDLRGAFCKTRQEFGSSCNSSSSERAEQRDVVIDFQAMIAHLSTGTAPHQSAALSS